MNHEREDRDELGLDISEVVKKARRKSIARTIAISTGIFVLAGFVVFVGNTLLLNYKVDQVLRDITLFNRVTDPNTYMHNYQEDRGFLGGTLTYQTYKVIEGVPVVWDEETVEYNVFGGFSRRIGGYSPIQLVGEDMADFPYARSYSYQTGERSLLFYHPAVKYEKILNDLVLLPQIGADKVVEMGISFDRAYTVEQVKAMLPKGVHPAWYWADTYSEEELKQMQPSAAEGKEFPSIPEQAFTVYGFHERSVPDPMAKPETENDFLTMLKDGMTHSKQFKQEFERIYQIAKDKQALIIGVVVTGTPETLKALQGQPYVRAAVLGATADRY
jgi:hypothetical protein